MCLGSQVAVKGTLEFLLVWFQSWTNSYLVQSENEGFASAQLDGWELIQTRRWNCFSCWLTRLNCNMHFSKPKQDPQFYKVSGKLQTFTNLRRCLRLSTFSLLSLRSPSSGNLHGVPARRQHLSPFPSSVRLGAEGSKLLSPLWRRGQQGQGGNHRQGGHHLHCALSRRARLGPALRSWGPGRHHYRQVKGRLLRIKGLLLFLVFTRVSSLLTCFQLCERGGWRWSWREGWQFHFPSFCAWTQQLGCSWFIQEHISAERQQINSFTYTPSGSTQGNSGERPGCSGHREVHSSAQRINM